MVSFAVRVFDMSSSYQQSAVPIPAWAQGAKVCLVFMFIRHLFCVVVRISPLIRWPIQCATTLLVQEYSDTDALPVRKSALNGGFSDEGKLTAPVKFLVTGSLSACKAVFQARAPLLSCRSLTGSPYSPDSKWNVLRRAIKPLMFLMCSLWLLLCFPHEAKLWLSAPFIFFWSKTISLKMHGYFNPSYIDENQFKIILLTIVRLFLLLRHKCLFYVLVIVHFTEMPVQFSINI